MVFFSKILEKLLFFYGTKGNVYVVDIIHFDIYEVGDIVIAILVEICRKIQKRTERFCVYDKLCI